MRRLIMTLRVEDEEHNIIGKTESMLYILDDDQVDHPGAYGFRNLRELLYSNAASMGQKLVAFAIQHKNIGLIEAWCGKKEAGRCKV